MRLVRRHPTARALAPIARRRTLRAPLAPRAAMPLPPPPPLEPGSKRLAGSTSLSSDFEGGNGERRLILIDGTALLYRAHHALAAAGARLTTAAGVDTAAAHGFVAQLLRLLELSPPPTHVAAVFDAAGKTFRHELYPLYKGHRPPAPPEIVAAAPRVRRLLRALGVADLSAPGVEADDIVGALATRAFVDGVRVAIVSPDKDFYALLRPGVQLLRPPPRAASAARGPAFVTVAGLVPYTCASFETDHSIPPSAWPDVRALCGDPSDNVPGVAGVGAKTALALIQRYGDLETALTACASGDPESPAKGKAKASLASPEGAAAARLARRLVQIQTTLDVPPATLPWTDLAWAPPAPGSAAEAAALAGLAELELTTAAARLRAVWESAAAAAAVAAGGGGLVPASSLPPRPKKAAA